ncbi:MAG: hypothetical protein NTW95_11875, partial [Candidatus Aminicenantes bacterium]|nr:hypothetical protein [Candidatus Aminicenantes bacterium]
RFREDPVRIWRVIRYASRAGFAITADTELEIAGQRHLLADCSGARLFEELGKDLGHAETRLVMAGLREQGILRHVIGRAGADYESDPALFARLLHLLAQADGEKARGGSIFLDEMAAILFWPWLEPLFAAEPGDMHPLLKKAFDDAGMKVSLPKSLRAQAIEILVLAGKMIRALGNGRMRWVLRERPPYAPAARLCFLIAKGRMPGKEESFESLFREAFPQIPTSDRRQRRRRRRRG